MSENEEDELLYREMNEEDPWYMGDVSRDNSSEGNKQSRQPKSGCVSLMLCLLVFFLWGFFF